MSYKKILFASDGSEQSLKAAHRLAASEPEWDAQIVIFFSFLYYYPNIVTPLPTMFISPISYYRRNPTVFPTEVYLDQVEVEVLSKTKKIFDEAGVAEKVSTRLVKDESPVDYAVRAVKEEEFDLVVLGARGQHSKLREVFLGSVCEEMMNRVSAVIL